MEISRKQITRRNHSVLLHRGYCKKVVESGKNSFKLSDILLPGSIDWMTTTSWRCVIDCMMLLTWTLISDQALRFSRFRATPCLSVSVRWWLVEIGSLVCRKRELFPSRNIWLNENSSNHSAQYSFGSTAGWCLGLLLMTLGAKDDAKAAIAKCNNSTISYLVGALFISLSHGYEGKIIMIRPHMVCTVRWFENRNVRNIFESVFSLRVTFWRSSGTELKIYLHSYESTRGIMHSWKPLYQLMAREIRVKDFDEKESIRYRCCLLAD